MTTWADAFLSHEPNSMRLDYDDERTRVNGGYILRELLDIANNLSGASGHLRYEWPGDGDKELRKRFCNELDQALHFVIDAAFKIYPEHNAYDQLAEYFQELRPADWETQCEIHDPIYESQDLIDAHAEIAELLTEVRALERRSSDLKRMLGNLSMYIDEEVLNDPWTETADDTCEMELRTLVNLSKAMLENE